MLRGTGGSSSYRLQIRLFLWTFLLSWKFWQCFWWKGSSLLELDDQLVIYKFTHPDWSIAIFSAFASLSITCILAVAQRTFLFVVLIGRWALFRFHFILAYLCLCSFIGEVCYAHMASLLLYTSHSTSLAIVSNEVKGIVVSFFNDFLLIITCHEVLRVWALLIWLTM